VNELLTVTEHSVRLGMDRYGKRLRKMLLAVVRRYPRDEIGVRYGREWRLTETELRRYLPQLFGDVGLDAIERRVREHLRDVDKRIDERSVAVCLPLVAAEREAREHGDRRVARLVADVAEKVAGLAVEVCEIRAKSEVRVRPMSILSDGQK
jgi:hypothetical protein